MKRTFIVLLISVSSLLSYSQEDLSYINFEHNKKDKETKRYLNSKEEIKAVIKKAYIEGTFNKGDVKLIKDGWHYDCDIVVYRKDKKMVQKNPAYRIVDMYEKGAKPFLPGTSCKIPFIHISGYAAIAVVEVFNDNKQLYTDYFNLYKLEDGWKIVTKTFFDHTRYKD